MQVLGLILLVILGIIWPPLFFILGVIIALGMLYDN